MKKHFLQAQVKASKKDEGIVTVVATSGVVDRHGQRVHPEGADIKHFKTNPVILWNHNMTFAEERPAIGKAIKIWKEGTGLNAKWKLKIQFDMEDEFARLVYGKYVQGILNTVSIGFISRDYDPESRVHKEWELLEVSAVNIPANPEARAEKALKTLGTTFKDMKEMIEKVGTVEIKPLENEHACRKIDPSMCEDGSFRTMERDHDGKKYKVIMARKKGEDTLSEQSYRYPKKTWTEAQAKKHCVDHDGHFEAAKKNTRLDRLESSLVELHHKVDALTNSTTPPVDEAGVKKSLRKHSKGKKDALIVALRTVDRAVGLALKNLK